MNKSIFPIGAAVHTRDINRGKDYGWHITQSGIWLFSYIKDIYRTVLRDTGGDTRKLALFIAEKRIGLLLCDIPSERIDHGNRIINDTLYVEFNETEILNVLEYAADLLVCQDKDYEIIQDKAVKYAEKLYHKTESKNEQYSISLLNIGGKYKKFSGKYAARFEKNENFFDNQNVLKCSEHLRWFAEKNKRFTENNKSFVFVSTGRVGIEKCKQLADQYDQCLILTMTSEIENWKNLRKNLRIEELKKIIPSILKKKIF